MTCKVSSGTLNLTIPLPVVKNTVNHGIHLHNLTIDASFLLALLYAVPSAMIMYTREAAGRK